MNCPNYVPGPVMGKERYICKYWLSDNSGVCTRQDVLMCCEWVAKQLGGKIVKQEAVDGNTQR